MSESALASRLARLPLATVLGAEFPVATGARARLLGLAGLPRRAAGAGLLIPRCSSVHTFGMRFPLDLCFLDDAGAVLAVRRRIQARRVVSCQGARAVLEMPAAQGGEIRLPRP
jgi:uncharacterized membrane protein (UPF0127 family)